MVPVDLLLLSLVVSICYAFFLVFFSPSFPASQQIDSSLYFSLSVWKICAPFVHWLVTESQYTLLCVCARVCGFELRTECLLGRCSTPLSQSPSPFYFSCFSGSILLLLRAGLRAQSFCLCLLHSWVTGTHLHAQLVYWNGGLLSFCWGWRQTSSSRIAGITGMCHNTQPEV
jgi:predicted membrane protein